MKGSGCGGLRNCKILRAVSTSSSAAAVRSSCNVGKGVSVAAELLLGAGAIGKSSGDGLVAAEAALVIRCGGALANSWVVWGELGWGAATLVVGAAR